MFTFGLKLKILSEDEETKQNLNEYYNNTNENIYFNYENTLQKNNINKNNCNSIDYEKINNKDVNSSGLDIITPCHVIIPAKSMGFKIKLGIACEPIKIYDDEELIEAELYYYKLANCGYYLYPRSSLSKTPLRLANSVGIIDSSYRGEIMAAVDNISEEDFEIKQGERLFQLCSPTLEPINYIVTNELSETQRGDGGFGSTGK
tara:strand:+ start:1639 stop:2250 length:612 start_codon:yes stop_codon:yes gene_type:complete